MGTLTCVFYGTILAMARQWGRGTRLAPCLSLLAELDDDEHLARSHRLPAVRAHLLDELGDLDGARQTYLLAVRRTLSPPERRYLLRRAQRLDE